MSIIGDDFEDLALPILLEQLGDDLTYTQADGTSLGTIKAIFNEFVGAIDEKSRAIFTISSSDVGDPKRGDRLTLAGRTWRVIDVRADQAGSFELRADAPQEEV